MTEEKTEVEQLKERIRELEEEVEDLKKKCVLKELEKEG